MREWQKEINMVTRYNEANGTNYEIYIDNFKGTFWVKDGGRTIGSAEMEKLWEYYG